MRTALSESDSYQFIIDLVYDRSGIRLHGGKEALIKARLGKRMRHLGFEHLKDYCEFVQTSEGDAEIQRVIEALTTHFTTFLREESHFHFLVDQALPALLPPGVKRFHIWSAACASGEEPYTLALFFAEYFPPAQGWDWSITASDISTQVLTQAKAGIYTEERVRTVPPAWLRKYFQRGVGQWEGHYRVKRSIAERVQFREINLISDYSHPQSFEAILCRNMMIYLDRPTQTRVLQKLCTFLQPTGYLLIGHSESLSGLNLPMRCLGPSVYQKGPR